jgi:hypothetical protein
VALDEAIRRSHTPPVICAGVLVNRLRQDYLAACATPGLADAERLVDDVPSSTA